MKSSNLSTSENLPVETTTANFNKDGDSQAKLSLEPIGVELLEQAFSVPMYSAVMKDAKIYNLRPAQRLQHSFLQFSFIVTIKHKKILLYKREAFKHTVTKIPARNIPTSKGSILLSSIPELLSPPKNQDAILNIFRRKIPAAAFAGQTPELSFLGIAKTNVVKKDSKENNKGVEQKTTYYYYIYEASFEKEPDINKLNIALMQEAGHDEYDRVLDFVSTVDSELLLDRIDAKLKADRGALELFGEKHDISALKRIEGASPRVYLYGKNPYSDYSNQVFISHATEDYDKYVLPFIRAVEEAGGKCWVHERDAMTGTRWKLSNEWILSQCKAFVSIETPYFAISPNTQTEAELAIKASQNNTKYEIIRLIFEGRKDDNSHPWLSRNNALLADFVSKTTKPLHVDTEAQKHQAIKKILDI